MAVRLVILILGLALAARSHAQTVKAQDPESIAAAMKSAGLGATVGTDGVGDPMISSAHKGTQFKILFYNCVGKRNCATIQFHSSYELGTAVTLDKINNWNRTQRFGRAFLDTAGDPVLQMDLDLDDGGLSRALFVDNLEFWTSVLERFEEHIGYRS